MPPRVVFWKHPRDSCPHTLPLTISLELTRPNEVIEPPKVERSDLVVMAGCVTGREHDGRASRGDATMIRPMRSIVARLPWQSP